MDSTAVPLAAIGLVATVLAVVVTPMFALLRNATKAQEANTKALEKMAASTDKVAAATVKGNAEAKQRNGHLGEQNVQIATMLTAQTSKLANIEDSNNRVAEILTDSAVLLVKDTANAAQGTRNVAELLKASGETLARDTETAFQGTEDVRKALKKNRAKGPFTIQGNLN